MNIHFSISSPASLLKIPQAFGAKLNLRMIAGVLVKCDWSISILDLIGIKSRTVKFAAEGT
jgi:hypothetical protein